jgi:Fe-S-cluster containining protein
MTDGDLRRIVSRTGERAGDIVRFVSRHEIDMDDEPEAFVRLRQGKRVMVLGHARGRCRYLGPDDRCTIYSFRPIGCRVFPLDPEFSQTGALRRLRLIQATECKYELDGKVRVPVIRDLHERHEDTMESYHAKVAEFNRAQKARLRAGQAAQTTREFLTFLGFEETGRPGAQSSRRYQLLQP